MTTDLKDQIQAFMEGGVRHVTAPEAAERASWRPDGRRGRTVRTPRQRGRIFAITAGATAAVCAGALVATQAGGGGGPGSPRPARTMLAAAFVRHLASTSRTAMVHSGVAVIQSRVTLDGVLQQTDVDRITYSGGNWNDSFTVSSPAAPGQAASSESAINRVVHGLAYDYFVANHGLAWYHVTGPDAVSSMNIPDPRKLLAELSPAARFVNAGPARIGGIVLEHLRATKLSGLPSIQLGSATPTGQLTSLDIWVDGNGVVHRMALTVRQVNHVLTLRIISQKNLPKGVKVIKARNMIQFKALLRELMRGKERVAIAEPGQGNAGRLLLLQGKGRSQIQITTMAVSFLDTGKPQVIQVPAHSFVTYGRG
jgi:hypothetical protein